MPGHSRAMLVVVDLSCDHNLTVTWGNQTRIAVKFDGPEGSRRMESRSKVLEKEKGSQVGVEVETVLQTEGIF